MWKRTGKTTEPFEKQYYNIIGCTVTRKGLSYKSKTQQMGLSGKLHSLYAVHIASVVEVNIGQVICVGSYSDGTAVEFRF